MKLIELKNSTICCTYCKIWKLLWRSLVCMSVMVVKIAGAGIWQSACALEAQGCGKDAIISSCRISHHKGRGCFDKWARPSQREGKARRQFVMWSPPLLDPPRPWPRPRPAQVTLGAPATEEFTVNKCNVKWNGHHIELNPWLISPRRTNLLLSFYFFVSWVWRRSQVKPTFKVKVFIT